MRARGFDDHHAHRKRAAGPVGSLLYKATKQICPIQSNDGFEKATLCSPCLASRCSNGKIKCQILMPHTKVKMTSST